jgi:hypothetical protein
MKSIAYEHLGEININADNCDEIFKEAIKIMELAIEVRSYIDFVRVKSFQHSMQVKRGIEFKKRHGFTRCEDLRAT